MSDDVVDVLKALSEQHALAPNSSAGSIPRLSREGSLQSEGPELLSSPNISHVSESSNNSKDSQSDSSTLDVKSDPQWAVSV